MLDDQTQLCRPSLPVGPALTRQGTRAHKRCPPHQNPARQPSTTGWWAVATPLQMHAVLPAQCAPYRSQRSNTRPVPTIIMARTGGATATPTQDTLPQRPSQRTNQPVLLHNMIMNTSRHLKHCLPQGSHRIRFDPDPPFASHPDPFVTSTHACNCASMTQRKILWPEA